MDSGDRPLLSKTSLSLDQDWGLQDQEADCGLNSPELLANLDRNTYSWKMSRLSSEGAYPPFLAACPKSGMTRSGKLYALPISEHRTDARVSISLPTPAARDYKDVNKSNRAYSSQMGRHSPSLASIYLANGATWQQLLDGYAQAMGFPLEWWEEESKDSETL